MRTITKNSGLYLNKKLQAGNKCNKAGIGAGFVGNKALVYAA